MMAKNCMISILILNCLKLKPLHAEWLVELYNQMSTTEGQKIIHSAWKASGITEAMKAGKSSPQPLDPFHDIDPMAELDDEGVDLTYEKFAISTNSS